MSKTCIVSAETVTELSSEILASMVAINAKLNNFKETQFLNGNHENYIGIDP